MFAHLLSGSGAVRQQYCKLITIFLNEDKIGYEPLGFSATVALSTGLDLLERRTKKEALEEKKTHLTRVEISLFKYLNCFMH